MFNGVFGSYMLDLIEVAGSKNSLVDLWNQPALVESSIPSIAPSSLSTYIYTYYHLSIHIYNL